VRTTFFDDRTCGRIVLHRGGRGPALPAENTIEAFECARRGGAKAIELDVRASRDGVPFVFHDRTLDRLVPGDRRQVDRVDAPDLARLRTADGLSIPRLDQVLRWGANQGVAINVEIKHDAPNVLGLVRRVIGDLRASDADVWLSSFDPKVLCAAAVLAPMIPRALLVAAEQWHTPVLLRAARRPWVQGIHVEGPLATPASIERFGRRGLRVGVWTVNEAARVAELRRHGVDWIITDDVGFAGARTA
jgi:glycerophosphoryl diester phosphodiesterase